MVKLFLCIFLHVKPHHRDQFPAFPPLKQLRKHSAILIVVIVLLLILIAVIVMAVFFGTGLHVTFST